MASKKVIDAYSLLAFFENKGGAEKVASLIKIALDKDRHIMISSVAWSEVCFGMYASMDKANALSTIENALTLPLEIVPLDQDMAKLAAEIRAENTGRKISFSDAASLALAKYKKATLITGKHDLKDLGKFAEIEVI